MPSEVRSPRTLSSWLELDYFRRRRLFSWWWWWIAGGAIAGAVALVLLFTGSGYRAFQAGPVTRKHTLFNDDCGQCHEKPFATVTRLWAGDAVGTVTDQKCQNCHVGDKHHGAVGRCVECHKEHRGHDALVRVGDPMCVKCHADLDSKGGGPRTGIANTVLEFTKDGRHPEFNTPKAARTLKFPHSVHLSTKGVMALDKDGKRFMRKPMECSECHVPDVGGLRMQPISYDQHCATCHPLGTQIVGVLDDEMRKLAAPFARERVVHPRAGQSAGQVRGSLRDALTRFIMDPKHMNFIEENGEPIRPLPDRGLLPGQGLRKDQFDWVNCQVKESERIVYQGGCLKCHTEKTPAAAAESGLSDLLPTNIRSRWWKHAVFRHDSHRFMNCADCHAAKNSTYTSEALMPTMAVCLDCHDTRKSPRARTGCVQCHAYHDPKGHNEAPPVAKHPIERGKQ